MSEQTRSLIERHDDAWNTHDVGALADLYTEDVVFQNHTAGEQPVKGRDAVLEHVAGIFERWPDLRFTSRRLYCRMTSARANGPHARRRLMDDGSNGTVST